MRFLVPGRFGRIDLATLPVGSTPGPTLWSSFEAAPTFQLMRRTAGPPSSPVAQERADARPGRRSLAVAISLLACLGAPVFITAGAGAQSIEDKQAQAEALADEIERNGMEISRLDEELLEAQIRIDELNAQIADTEQGIGATRAAAQSTDADLRSRTAELYVTGATGPELGALEGGSFSDAAAREIYLEVAVDRDEELLDDLRVANERLRDQLGEQEDARAEADAQKARLDESLAALESANDRQRELLEQTQGELEELIRAEQARREREEAERARRAADDADDSGNDSSNDNDDSGNDGSNDDNDNGSNDDNDNGSNDDNGGPTVVAPNPRAQIAVDAAVAQVGTPYSFATPGSWDNPDPDSFDCSGLTGWAWYRAGYSLPHSSRAQFASLPHVSQGDLQPGDLVFYGSPIHHVGMFIGNGQYVHAPQTGDVVKISTIYRDDWAGGARVPG